MKKLLVIPTILAAMATPAYIVSQHPKVITVTKQVPITVTKTETKTLPPPVYHVGDTQGGVTLVGEYSSSYQDLMGGNGPTPHVVAVTAFALAGADNKAAMVLLTDGSYQLGGGGYTIPECKSYTCVVFTVPKDQIKAFYFEGLKWNL